MTFLVVDGENQLVCPCNCVFCIRRSGPGVYGSEPLWLEREPTVEETIESLEVSAKNLSKTYAKKIAMHSDYDESKNSFYISAFLIAQFGKNANVSKAEVISGREWMEIVLNHLRTVRDEIAGNLVYLECEEITSLISFYECNGFVRFGERFSKSEDAKYIQLLRFL